MTDTPQIISTEHIAGDIFAFECHPPGLMESAHFHGHVELIYFAGCEADYFINGIPFHVSDGRLTLFWANIPHQLTNLKGEGLIYIANIPLSDFLALPIPQGMRDEILSGKVLQANDNFQLGRKQVESWHQQCQIKHPTLNKIIQDEVGLTLRKLGFYGWTRASAEKDQISGTSHISPKGLQHVSNMMKFINHQLQESISISDVAEHAGLQTNYALTLFSSVMNISIKQYILRQRLQLAQVCLMESNRKITAIAFDCGFGSISRFYDVFTRHFGVSPSRFRKQLTQKL